MLPSITFSTQMQYKMLLMGTCAEEMHVTKMHKKMTLNLIVPLGKIRFVLYDDREATKTKFQDQVQAQGQVFRLYNSQTYLIPY